MGQGDLRGPAGAGVGGDAVTTGPGDPHIAPCLTEDGDDDGPWHAPARLHASRASSQLTVPQAV